jgi:zinc finger protein
LEQEVRGTCPSCGEEVDWLYKTENIPYFSDILIITCSCPDCGYRFSDVQNITTNEPVRYTFCACCEDDLSVRVVRSSAGKIIIPELGVEIDPGPACEGFVSNVEGVLLRIDKVLDGVLIDGDDIQRRNALSLKEKIVNLQNGKGSITLIIEDPHGNSLIDSEKAEKGTYCPDNS